MDITEHLKNPAELDFIRATKPQRIKNILLQQVGRSVIDISDNYIADDGLLVVLDFLTEHNCLPEKLYLRGNKLTGKSLGPLAAYLVHHDTIKYLSLEWNEINDPIALSNFVMHISSMNLLILNLKSTKINYDFDDALVQLIGNASTLLEVDLSWNELNNTSAKKIIEALRVNRRLVSLGLRGNNVSQNLSDEVEQLCERNLNDQPRVIDLLNKLKIDCQFDEHRYPVEEPVIEARNTVRENLVEYLKEDLTNEKHVNNDLANRVQLLATAETTLKSKIANFQRENEILTLDNERLILENKNLKVDHEELKMTSGTRINGLEGQIRALQLSLESKEQEYTLKLDKYTKENKTKLTETVKQWENK